MVWVTEKKINDSIVTWVKKKKKKNHRNWKNDRNSALQLDSGFDYLHLNVIPRNTLSNQEASEACRHEERLVC